MIELKDFVQSCYKTAQAGQKNLEDITAFLQSNRWYGVKPVDEDGKLYISEEDAAMLSERLVSFLKTERSKEAVFELLSARFSATAKAFLAFADSVGADDESCLNVGDFLLKYLTKELAFYTNEEAEELVNTAAADIQKCYGDILTFFMAWLRSKTKTQYDRDFMMQNRYTMEFQNAAYSMDEYLELLYDLFNEDYIQENEMYKKAAESANFCDTWLYLAMHYICSLRTTDLVRIYNPILPYSPEETLKRIRSGGFTNNDCRKVLLSITEKLACLPLYPNKTKRTSNVPSIKLIIPDACETLFGRLFAAAQAHRELAGTPDEPIIRKVSTYSEITRYMGDEIGSLFLTGDFRSRSATKSYLQAIYMLTDDILADDEDAMIDKIGPGVKGYLLSAMARSHKGTFVHFAKTTMEYLNDAKFSGLTPEFVSFELLQRGVCSNIVTMLLQMLKGDDYKTLSVSQQTQLHKELGLSPKEVNDIVMAVNRGYAESGAAIREAVTKDTDLLTTLHRIGTGQAFSKQLEELCLNSALGRICPYGDKKQCIICKFEICTKATFYLVSGEIAHMRKVMRESDDLKEKERCKAIATNVLLPKLSETLSNIRLQYGEKAYRDYEALVKEASA